MQRNQILGCLLGGGRRNGRLRHRHIIGGPVGDRDHVLLQGSCAGGGLPWDQEDSRPGSEL